MTAKYTKYEVLFDFWCRPLWDWVLDLIENPSMAPYFEWDAQKLYKYDGTKYIRFIHEPWTAARFWEVQVGITPTCYHPATQAGADWTSII